MRVRTSIKCTVTLLLLTFVPGWTATLPSSRPPENYKGPSAERPVLQKADYWVYQRADLTRIRSTALPPNIDFPLWIGKTWSYDTEMTRFGQPTKTARRSPARIDCQVTGVEQVVVAAGTFEAFKCKCECTHQHPTYQPGCGEWTIWYSPEVKNIISRKTESTATSIDLVEYRRTSGPRVAAETPARVSPPLTQTEVRDLAESKETSKALPQVVKITPSDGATDVPVSVKEIAIIFDKPMTTGWQISCTPSFYPNEPEGRRCSASGTFWRDAKTFVIPLTVPLQSNRHYSLTINNRVGLPSFNLSTSFRGLGQSEPVAPQRFAFKTAQ